MGGWVGNWGVNTRHRRKFSIHFATNANSTVYTLAILIKEIYVPLREVGYRDSNHQWAPHGMKSKCEADRSRRNRNVKPIVATDPKQQSESCDDK